MKKLLTFLFLFPFVLGVSLDPRVVGSECKYKRVAASTTCTSGGLVVPNGETWAVYRWQANGADPSAYVALVWDYDGAGETIFSSTKGDVHLHFDVSQPIYQVTGDGVKKLQIVIYNDHTSETPIIGGCIEAVKIQ